MAFVSAAPVLGRPLTTSVLSSSFAPTHLVRVAPTRRASMRMAIDEDKSIPQGFTFFSEQLNGRAAMFGFMLALVTEAITGKGIIGQLGSVVDTAKEIIPF